jgi:hypothetical protein
VGDESDIQPVEGYVLITPSIDMEKQSDIADTLGRPRREGAALETRQGHTTSQLQFSK